MSQKQSGSATKIVASPHSNQPLATENAGTAAAALADRALSVDDQVAAAFASLLAPQFPEGLALLAVGGYGRRELFPFSDVDLLLLTSRDIQGDALSSFLQKLWDSGLRMSQSVRTVPECCSIQPGNVELSISLLDERFLAGDMALYRQLTEKLPRFFRNERDALVRQLCRMSRERHAKFQNTIYHLEPNVKEGPGGLRDLQVVEWLSKLRGSRETPAEELASAREFVSALRRMLHLRAGRDQNVLAFAEQDLVSSDPAAWMRDYYLHARAIYRAAAAELGASEALVEGGLLQSFLDWRARLSNAEFSVHRERVFFRAPQQIQWDPDIVLRFFLFVARHDIRPSPEASRRVALQISMLREHWGLEHRIWPVLRDILSQPHPAIALRAMYETRALLALFPEWNEIECLVIRDFYHRYTVDEHTLIAIETLERLRTSKDQTRRRFVDLINETEDIPLLIMAILFHDAGKGSGSSHEVASARLAAKALKRIQMPPVDAARVVFLIERHLDLSSVMNSRDLDDPATARDLASRVGTIENLKLLTLLTYADISAVNPEAMTSWRLAQLWRVYSITQQELTRELTSDRIHLEGAEHGPRAAFLEGLPTRYLRTHGADEISAHIQLAEAAAGTGAGIAIDRREGGYAAAIVTRDHENLFASLAGVLAGFGMNILKAEAFANSHGMVVDTFSFSDPMRTLELNPQEIDRLRVVLQRAALGKEDVRKLIKGRVPKHVPSHANRVRTSVTFDDSASEQATLIEIVAEDRPGLLFEVASALSSAGCNIDVVLIDTEAHKALDTFYVTRGGAKLADDLQASLKRQLMAICSGQAA